MELIAAAQFAKAQHRPDRASGDYTSQLCQDPSATCASVGRGCVHPLLEIRRTKPTGRCSCITGDRGLCGGYKSNVVQGQSLAVVGEWKSDAGARATL